MPPSPPLPPLVQRAAKGVRGGEGGRWSPPPPPLNLYPHPCSALTSLVAIEPLRPHPCPSLPLCAHAHASCQAPAPAAPSHPRLPPATEHCTLQPSPSLTLASFLPTEPRACTLATLLAAKPLHPRPLPAFAPTPSADLRADTSR